MSTCKIKLNCNNLPTSGSRAIANANLGNFYFETKFQKLFSVYCKKNRGFVNQNNNMS